MAGTAVRYFQLGLIVLVVAFGGVVLGEKGLGRTKALEEKRLSLVRENEELSEELASLAHDLQRLRTDPKTIETVAKRKLGMIRPDETIYLFERPDSGNRPPISEYGSRKGHKLR
ncbi:MAG: septum formation initiator family protein [Thermodesulfobacteriota bacterium]